MSGGQTAAAILSATGASTLSLSVLAQAVGLSVNTTELVAGTYLYQLPPSTTQGFVQKLQSAFRDAAAARQRQINTPEAAYYMTQRYLDLCLPPRIEAEIIRQINGTVAGRVDTGDGALFSLETVSFPSASPPVLRGEELLAGLHPRMIRDEPWQQASSRRPTRRRKEAGAGLATSVLASLYAGSSLNPANEESMTRALRSLCVSPAEIRNPGPLARDLLSIYQETRGAEATGRIGDQDIRMLLGQRPCSAPHRNYFEKSRFPQGSVTTGTVRLLNKAMPSGPISGTPDLDAIRPQIRAVRAVSSVSSRLKPRASDFSDQLTSDLIDALESL